MGWLFTYFFQPEITTEAIAKENIRQAETQPSTGHEVEAFYLQTIFTSFGSSFFGLKLKPIVSILKSVTYLLKLI
ncbi:hypothetical protein [Algoriphagus antarcticus]|uniref:Uncharacterized protein n=1 Tax=Algoriphagus antarcticus TaxID=238540 RepID=A0A3E0DUK6_9BACT|nr:hypothetical protein [Algoriphagus antarcticus]REG88268.1 hypothetical protein C8N25_11046 [Algoriphagus antarcticus]